MTKDQQAALERVARGAYERLIPDTPGINKPNVTMLGIKRKAFMEEIVTLLAAQRAAVLEEVANEMARHPYWSKEADVWIKHLRQLAQEQRP